jgi:hypothetical protein
MLSTRNSVLLWPSVFALALSAAAPAGAILRTAPYSWAHAPGPVAGYRVYLSVDGGPEQSYGYVTNPSALIWIESGAELVVRVAAFDTVGSEGPRSDASPPLRLCPGDFDGDEIIGYEDRNRALSCVYQPATGACAAAEIVVDGTITSSDILALEVGSYACGEPPVVACPGDTDGDGVISAWDLSKVRSCVGLYAEGACADADLDGNGYVTALDWLACGRAIGTTCSN